MSTNPDRGVVRLFRGGVVGVVAAVVAVCLHSWSHGTAMSLSLAFTVLPPAVIIGAALANRRYTFWRAFGVLLAVQPLMHLIALSTEHAGHAADSWTPVAPDEQMFLAHVVAAALAAWWVAVGDRVLWEWVGDIRRAYAAPLALPALKLGQRSPLAATPVAGHPGRDLLSTAPRRGPPKEAGRIALCT